LIRQQQRSLAARVSCTGLGLHCGSPVRLTLSPAPPDTGIVFLHVDARTGDRTAIPARVESIVSSSHATTLGAGAAQISTVEHLLATLHAFSVDNAWIEVEGPEIPIMDGSAGSFVYLLRSAGIVAQQARRRVLRVERAVEVSNGSSRIRIEPGRGLRVHYVVDFPHPAIGRQAFTVGCLGPELFESELAPARTFGFLDEVSSLWRAGLARGGSLENTIVLGDDRVLNPGGLRWPDEFARHKMLDLLGDLALLGCAIEGRLRVERGGHSLHHALLRRLLATPEVWSLFGDAPVRDPHPPEPIRAAAGDR
jgi:UDP-3-O-[3-hydroxymyristoyl] N-acetylglucosamine deacetylase